MVITTTAEARRTFWATQMEAAHAFMLTMLDYPVAECGEPMAPLLPAAEDAGVEVTASPLPHAEGKPRIYALRQSLLPAFLAAAREMNARGWVLKLEDVFRTMAMQRYNARRDDVFLGVLRMTQWECHSDTPPLDLLVRRLDALVACAPKVGTHMSGSALDISVLDRDTGEEIDRGAPYVEMSELTPMASPFVSERAQRNRQDITEIMGRHGFVAYPWEFWHYSTGDAYAEYLNHTGHPARYGPVHLDQTTWDVTPITEAAVRLNAPEEIAALLNANAQGMRPNSTAPG